MTWPKVNIVAVAGACLSRKIRHKEWAHVTREKLDKAFALLILLIRNPDKKAKLNTENGQKDSPSDRTTQTNNSTGDRNMTFNSEPEVVV